ncbi:hypothetical protein [Spongiimicrobium salis]|uniref:hypothetical protein n=1 Tax=Spongiimicrobium salis TaxID=1667022 RepID=UPI00374D3301
MLKKITLVIVLSLGSMAYGQEIAINTFDFWLGEWELQWQKGDGTQGHGTNSIVRILDGKVIQENFEDPESGFKGMSLSVFNPISKKWHQAWADNAGGYYDFVGDIDNENPIFTTKAVQQGEKTIIQRMVFKDITKDALVWDWEKTEDGGKQWQLQWRIHYTRKKP